MKKVIYFLILILLSLGIYGASGLVFTEFTQGNGCPHLGFIPACLIILICLIIPFFVHLINKWNYLYFIFTGIAASIALIASLLQLFEKSSCPKTGSGTPMCYYSLLIFSSLIVLKLIHKKTTTGNHNSSI